MKQWLGLSVVLPLLVACGADAELNVTSESVPQVRIDTIKQYIQIHYSKLPTETQQMIFEVGVEAIENQVAVEAVHLSWGILSSDVTVALTKTCCAQCGQKMPIVSLF
ncbi:MAG: hypothetical protein JKY55_12635 [Aliivibrio sp.]|uniref:hypothetical protein n=1 Tax=Aliivibrio sp. TaxID=1872443 RepID=UPI001A489AF7|nr:hypothetical protein [Aliivibrio sp.]